MSDHESIPFEGSASSQPEGNPPSNRPAAGANQGTPGDIYEDLWEGSGQGTDFLGLEQDLDGAAPLQDANAPTISYPSAGPAGYAEDAGNQGAGGGLETSQPVPQAYAPSFQAESDPADAEDTDEIPGYDEEPGVETPEGPKVSVGSGAGIWIGVGLALGLGAAAVVAVDYFGVLPEAEMAVAERTPSKPKPPVVHDAGGAVWSEGVDGTAENGADPLLDKLATGAELSEAPKAGYAPTGELAFPDALSWDRAQTSPDPFLTVASWFAPEGSGNYTAQHASSTGAVVPDLVAVNTESSTTTRPRSYETGEPVGPDTPEGELEMPVSTEGDATEARGGQARFEAFAPRQPVPALGSPLDLAMMDVVWRGPEVPFSMFNSGTKIWTPQVGAVRATTVRGEVFDGRLVAVGQDRVWIASDLGELALEAHTLDTMERLPDVLALAESSDIASAAGKRVKATTAGGAFEGRVLAVQGSKVILVTDTGARITLEEPDLEPVREGIRVKIKMN